MLNFRHMTDSEFLNYVENINPNDPIVKRLVEIINNLEDTDLAELEEWRELGDDPSEVKYKIEDHENDEEELRYEIDQLNSKLERLSRVSITEFLKTVADELDEKNRLLHLIRRELSETQDKLTSVTSKFKLWVTLNKEVSE